MKIETAFHLAALLKFNEPYILIRPRIVCSDGFSVSIQASYSHYCIPRNNIGPYTHFEIGFPSEIVDSWMRYCESRSEAEDPRQQIYSRVPIQVIVDELNRHGNAELINSDFVYVPERMRGFEW